MIITPARASGAAPAPFAASPFAQAAAAAHEHAPYLRRLMNARPDLLADIDANWPERLLTQAIAEANALALAPPAIVEGMRTLRRAKQAAHLAIAIADLADAWPLMRVTGALTDFADAALRAALALGARVSGERGEAARVRCTQG